MKITVVTTIVALKSLVIRRIFHLSIIFIASVANAGVIFEEQFTDAGLPGWTYHETTTYNRGTIVSGVEGGALRVYRSGSSGAFGNIGYRRSVSLPVDADTRVRFAIYPVSSSVRNYTGDGNGEYPAQVAIKCSTPNGPFTFIIAYNEDAVDRPNRSWGDGCQISRTRVQGWLTNESYGIRDYVPNATEITEIDLLSSGWDFEGQWDSLTIEDSAGTNEYNAVLSANDTLFSDTSGTANSRYPGVDLVSYPAGSTIRITVAAVQYGLAPFAVDAVLNIDGPGVQDFATPLYDSHISNGDVRRSLISGIPQFISWDWTIPVNATAGEYYIASTLRLASNFNLMVATIDTVDNILNTGFLVYQPLASPSGLAMDPASDTAPVGAPASFFSDGITKDNTPTLSCGSVSGALAYRWQVVDTGNNIIEEKTTTTTSCTPSTLGDGSYRVRVRAMESNDWLGRWCDYVGFTIDTIAPSAPVLSAPQNGSTVTNAMPVLTWASVTDAGGLYNYEVTYERSRLLPDEETAYVSETSYIPEMLSPDHIWYWRVKATDRAGNIGEVSQEYQFLYKNFISRVFIKKFQSSLPANQFFSMSRNLWISHLPNDVAGTVPSYRTIVELEWETETPSRVDVYATAYGINGEQAPATLVTSMNVTNNGFLCKTFGESYRPGLNLPGNENTYEVIVSAFIFNENNEWKTPAYVAHSVLVIPENHILGARPTIPNIAWAQKDLLSIQNKSFTTNQDELYALYNQYRTAYDEVRAAIIADTQQDLNANVREALNIIMPIFPCGMFKEPDYSVSDGLLELAQKSVEFLVEYKAGVNWDYYQLFSYISRSQQRIDNHQRKALEIELYGRMCSLLADAFGGSRVTATDGRYVDKIDISWTIIESEGVPADSYIVYRGTSDNRSSAIQLPWTVTGQSYSDTNVAPGTTYFYWIEGCVNGVWMTAEFPDTGYATTRQTMECLVSSEHGSPSPVGTQTFSVGAVVSNSVSSPVSGASGVRYICTGYTGTGDAPSGSGTSCSFTLNQNSTLTWNWKTQYWLDVGTSGIGILSTDDSWLDAGANLQITASPSNHWHFTQWRGDTGGCSIVGNSIYMAMDGPHTVTAGFVIDQHKLMVTTPYGQANLPVGTNWFDYGSANRLVITNSPVTFGGTQYVCRGWTGTGSIPATGSTTNTTTFVLTNDSSIVWNWRTNYWFQSDKIGKGTINLNTNIWIPLGTMLTQTATPAQYYCFYNWQGQTNGCSIASNRISFTMNSARLIIGCFNAILTSNNVPYEWFAQYGWTNSIESAATNDSDCDGLLNWQEWLAGCNPMDSNSVFRFTRNETHPFGQGMIIRWPSISNRFYDLSRATNLMGETPFTTLLDASNMPSMPPENVYTDSVQGVGPYYYKVGVHQ